jgi:hypothetical protein
LNFLAEDVRIKPVEADCNLPNLAVNYIASAKLQIWQASMMRSLANRQVLRKRLSRSCHQRQ